MASYTNRKAGLHTRPHPQSLAGQRIPRLRDGVIVDLALQRRRRLARDLGLTPTAAAPCTGVCRCYGVPLGGRPA
jgi:hypothetical protein